MEMLTVTDTAIILGVHPDTVRRLINTGRLNATVVGEGAHRRHLRVHPDDIDRWRASQSWQPQPVAHIPTPRHVERVTL